MSKRNLREMLAEAKDMSELMVDLAYASLFFDDKDMADEVDSLEVEISDLVYQMRTLAVLAVRNPREAEEMSSVLQVISSVEGIANDAVYISHVVTRRLGIPKQLIVDLMQADEVSHRVEIAEASQFANATLEDFELPVTTGMRVLALRRSRQWIVDPDGDQVLHTGDVLFLRGSPEGIPKLRELAGAPHWSPPLVEDDSQPLTDLDRAVDTIIEMKDLSEVAVGLAYSALVFKDKNLASRVRQLEDRLDEMKERLELWVLRASGQNVDPARLRGLLHLAEAAEDLGNQAKQMVWIIEKKDGEYHEVLEMALGDTDDVVVLIPIAEHCEVLNKTIAEVELKTESGFSILAIERQGRYIYRPRYYNRFKAGDKILANGPEEGHEIIARMFGWNLIEDDDLSESKLEPLEYIN